jgi:hypothetical protein
MRVRFAGLILAVAALATGASGADRSEWGIPVGPCGSAEPAKPQRRKSGEALPPLPLPATPQRRTERKRQPAPPPLIAKIQFGPVKETKHDGKVMRYHDWNKDPGDIPVLLNIAKKQLDVRYTYKRGPLGSFPADAASYPIFYYTGSDGFRLSDAEKKHLREFIRGGGTIWGDSCFGDPRFFKAFVREMSELFPQRNFRRLPLRHPLFHCLHEIQEVKYTREVPDAGGKVGPPVVYGVDVGCRTAIILSRYDLSCGWDGHVRQGAMNVHPNDARRLGVNMVAYSLSTHRIGQYQSVAKEYFEKEKRARGDFQFAQAKLGDNWDTQHNAIANLLKTVATETSVKVKFSREAVEVGSAALQKYPFLYMTGHHDFVFSDTEIASLKRFIRSGGFVLGSPCCGSLEFDKAFRREMARVLPGNELKTLNGAHPVYHILNDISVVQYSSYVQRTGEIGPALPLEGITLGAVTPVIYCPYGLGGGWRGFDHPYARDVSSADAMKIGANVVLYAMTH